MAPWIVILAVIIWITTTVIVIIKAHIQHRRYEQRCQQIARQMKEKREAFIRNGGVFERTSPKPPLK